jgi:long-chain fatty acid transport protein
MKKVFALLTICSPLLLKAQGFQVNLQGQKQQGMGGTGTGIVHDGASLFFNPGGVSFLKQNGISVGVTPVISHVNYVDAASSDVSETNSPVSFPFTTYMVFGKKESKLKYGLAVYTPFGSAIEWQDGWTGRFALTRLQLATVYFQPTLSYKISDQLGIGAGFVYGIGKVNLERDMPLVDEQGNYGHAKLDGKANGFGFNAGIYYQPSANFSIGLNYRSEVKMKVDDGDATFKVPASMETAFPSGKFSSSLPLPKTITLGFGYNASKKLQLAFDATMVGWKSFDTLAFDYAQNTPYLADTKSAREYKNTFSYRLGAQYTINDKIAARAGIKYLETPVQDGYVTPEVPDASHINYSLGLGYKLSSRLTVDMSFTIQSMKRSDTNNETQMSGSYKTNIYMPGISLNYNF